MKRESEGQLYVWSYPETAKSWAGWHLTADRAGCERLLAAIDKLPIEPQSLSIAPATAAVLAAPNNRRAEARSPAKLRLSLAPDERQFHLEEIDGVLTIEVGSARLGELRENIVGITRHEGDFAMVPDGNRRPRDQALWFWWLLVATS